MKIKNKKISFIKCSKIIFYKNKTKNIKIEKKIIINLKNALTFFC